LIEKFVVNFSKLSIANIFIDKQLEIPLKQSFLNYDKLHHDIFSISLDTFITEFIRSLVDSKSWLII